MKEMMEEEKKRWRRGGQGKEENEKRGIKRE